MNTVILKIFSFYINILQITKLQYNCIHPVILQKYGWYTLQLEINKQHVVAHLLLAAFFQLFTGATVAWVVCLQFLANSLLTH